MNLGRAAAIKVLPASLAGDPERMARFEREAQTLASLNHPNIAQIFGFEKGEGFFRAMLFLVDGKGTRHVDCSAVDLPYGRALVSDVLDRTETAMPQAHCFLVTELALRAQQAATRLERS